MEDVHLCQTVLFHVHVQAVTLEVLAKPMPAYRTLVKTTACVHLYLMALFHVHAQQASLAINVKQISVSQIHA